MAAKLFVGNIPYRTTEEELQRLFAQAGEVKSVSIITERETGRSKGFAFVEMGSQEEAEKAISLFNGHMLGDREIKVDAARPREERSGGGGYGGRSGGGRGGERRGGSDRGSRGRGNRERRGGDYEDY